jgi:hypothetical protein
MDAAAPRSCDVCKTPLTSDQLVQIGGQYVCAQCKPNVLLNLKSGVGGGQRVSPEQALAIKKQISRLNLLSFAFALPGLVLLMASGALAAPGMEKNLAVLATVRLLGALLFLIGMFFYARMRGRGWAWGFLGLLSCLGLLILYFLPKHCRNCQTSASYRARDCAKCGAPV